MSNPVGRNFNRYFQDWSNGSLKEVLIYSQFASLIYSQFCRISLG